MTAPAPPKANPLNPVLYGLLQHKFGTVRIASEGVPAQVESFPDPLHPGRTVTRAATWGEYYTVCCPFCNDNNFKLWINHRYGVEYNQKTGRRADIHLACCYKKDCVTGRMAQLEDIIFGPGRKLTQRMSIRQVPPVALLTHSEPPGVIKGFDELPESHPAAEYLRQTRNFDPLALQRDFGIGVCVELADNLSDEMRKKLRMVKGRIYIPIYMHKQLVGWQARQVGDSTFSVKYYNGMKRNQVLYNYDVASHQPVVVLVEGVPSVWRLGAAAVCLFGKTMSLWQSTTIATTWVGKPVFLMLDYGADAEIEAGLSKLCQHGMTVVPVILPDERDPADYSRPELQAMLSDAAAALDVKADLSFLN